MIWKDIKGYSNYQVSDGGLIRNTRTGRLLKLDKSSNGYYRATLCEGNKPKKYLIHRLVMLAFKGESLLQVNHINGDKSDNTLKNLEYVTCSENHLHAQRLGLRAIGSSRKSALLNEETVRKVCSMFCKGHTRGEILKAGISPHLKKHMVDNIRRRRTWKHVSCDYEW